MKTFSRARMLSALLLSNCADNKLPMFASTDTDDTGTAADPSGCLESLPASATTCDSGTVEAGELCLPETPQTFSAGSYRLPRRNLLVGDFSGDAVSDLFVGGQIFTGTLTDSTLSFTAAPVAIVGSETLIDVDVGDLNDDGMTDVVSSHRNINPWADPDKAPDLREIRFWWGNTTMDVSDRLNMAVGQYPFYVEVADLDGDGTDELAVSSRDEDVNNCGVVLRDPTPMASDPFQILGVFPADLSLDCRFATGRLDKDALIDLVPATDPFVYLAVAPEDDSFMLQPSMSRPAITTAHYGINVDCSQPPGAIDHDPTGLRLWIQEPDFEFKVEHEFSATNVNAHAVGDLNHDGDPDIAVCSEGGIELYLGEAGTAFSTGLLVTPENCDDVVIHDLNGDGGNDLAFLAADDTVGLLINSI